MPSEPYLGEIFSAGFNFAPQGYLPCDGRLLAISQNSALFALLGIQFGGDGIRTFALPDLRGRVSVGTGTGPGLSPYEIGETAGEESVALNVVNLPSHTHALAVTTANGSSASPAGNVPARSSQADKVYGTTSNATAAAGAIAATGGGQPHENRQPLLALNYYIAVQGIFPSRP